MDKMKAVVSGEMIDRLHRRSSVVVDHRSSLDCCCSYDFDIRWECLLDLKVAAAMISRDDHLCNRNLCLNRGVRKKR